jgi:DNA polymerase/3'-5' exonuclease PolX
MTENPPTDPHQTDRKEKVLQGIPGLGPIRIQKLLKRYPNSNLNDIRAAAWSHDIQNIPGFGQKLERELIKALTVNALSEAGQEPNLPKLPFF